MIAAIIIVEALVIVGIPALMIYCFRRDNERTTAHNAREKAA